MEYQANANDRPPIESLKFIVYPKKITKHKPLIIVFNKSITTIQAKLITTAAAEKVCFGVFTEFRFFFVAG